MYKYLRFQILKTHFFHYSSNSIFYFSKISDLCHKLLSETFCIHFSLYSIKSFIISHLSTWVTYFWIVYLKLKINSRNWYTFHNFKLLVKTQICLYTLLSRIVGNEIVKKRGLFYFSTLQNHKRMFLID